MTGDQRDFEGLPYLDEDHWEDEYAQQAERRRREMLDLDDRPLWHQKADTDLFAPVQGPSLPQCSDCYRLCLVDEFGTCLACRVRRGWCRWCAELRIAYTTEQSCRTCYRWFRRNEDGFSDDELVQRLAVVIARRKARARGKTSNPPYKP